MNFAVFFENINTVGVFVLAPCSSKFQTDSEICCFIDEQISSPRLQPKVKNAISKETKTAIEAILPNRFNPYMTLNDASIKEAMSCLNHGQKEKTVEGDSF